MGGGTATVERLLQLEDGLCVGSDLARKAAIEIATLRQQVDALQALVALARRDGIEACRQQIKATADSYPRAKRMLDPNDPSDRAQMMPLFQIAYILDREHERMAELLK